MKAIQTEGKPALAEFKRTMRALFQVPKSAVTEKPKPKKKRG
jgi:hypothetical protein